MGGIAGVLAAVADVLVPRAVAAGGRRRRRGGGVGDQAGEDSTTDRKGSTWGEDPTTNRKGSTRWEDSANRKGSARGRRPGDRHAPRRRDRECSVLRAVDRRWERHGTRARHRETPAHREGAALTGRRAGGPSVGGLRGSVGWESGHGHGERQDGEDVVGEHGESLGGVCINWLVD